MANIKKLPAPTFDSYEWQFEGACRQADPRLFFHPDGERGPAKRKREDAALAYCSRCPVVDDCRRHGLVSHEEFGVWGGTTESDRQAIRRVMASIDDSEPNARRAR